MSKAHVEGLDAYTREFLDWYTRGKRYFNAAGDDQGSVEALLLEPLEVLRVPNYAYESKRHLFGGHR
jgi:hypothetical protein